MNERISVPNSRFSKILGDSLSKYQRFLKILCSNLKESWRIPKNLSPEFQILGVKLKILKDSQRFL